MTRYLLILSLLFLPFLSCKSMPQSEASTSRPIHIGSMEGSVDYTKISGNILKMYYPDGFIQINFDINKSQGNRILSNADSFKYYSSKDPMGPEASLQLFDNGQLLSWVSEGFRGGVILSGLNAGPGKEENELILKSTDNEWVIPSDTETVVNWGDGDYIAYASQISKGKMADQPPFRVNLILLKK